MLKLNSPTMHNANTKFANKEIYKVAKCAHIQMHSKKAKQSKSMCVCALCIQRKQQFAHIKTTPSSPTKRLAKLQSMHMHSNKSER
jgi:hypothetical protein